MQKRTLKQKLKKNQTRKKQINNHLLYPPIKPLEEQYLQVSKLHSIYYATYGNVTGKPVLFIHGGPGGGTTPDMARFFNPKKYYIILVDQRGCGKSKPSAELRENNTNNLINDFEQLRQHLQIKQWMLFGGSWGSTLSLAYAIKYPHHITEIIVRGIFFCTDEEVKWFDEPNGANNLNPEGWKLFKKPLKYKKDKTGFMQEYVKCFQEKGKYTKEDKDKCLLNWSVWETSMSSIHKKKLSEIIKETKKDNYKQVSAIEAHYFKNKCFFTPYYITQKQNINKLKKIPMVIVQGIYDFLCPFINAYKLHQLLPHAQFYPTVAGHTAMDPENIRYLVKATDSFV